MSQGVGLYNSLVVDVRRSFASGFQFRGNYTYSKNLDDGSAWNTSVSGNTPAFVEFPLNPKLDWGPAATDVRHAASFNGSYELPFGPEAPLPATRFQAGPLSRLRLDCQRHRHRADRLPLHAAARLQPHRQRRYPQSCSAQLESRVLTATCTPRTSTNTSIPQAFLPPATGTYGNVSRDALTGPGLTQLDFSATRNAHLPNDSASSSAPSSSTS